MKSVLVMELLDEIAALYSARANDFSKFNDFKDFEERLKNVLA